MTTRFECRDLSGGRGSLTAFRNVHLALEPGTVHAVLGPNGAGKTTLLLSMAGLLPTQGGEVRVDGVTLPAGKATVASRAGVVLVPDNRELFTTLTLEENLRIAAGRSGVDPRSILQLFPSLEQRWNLRAGALSGGEQQMLAIGRALVQQPKVLLVDELSMGLAPTLVERIYEALREVATATSCTVVFVEQFIGVALQTADSACVLNRGRVVMHGPAAEIASEPARLEQAYLGDGEAASAPRGPRRRTRPLVAAGREPASTNHVAH